MIKAILHEQVSIVLGTWENWENFNGATAMDVVVLAAAHFSLSEPNKLHSFTPRPPSVSRKSAAPATDSHRNLTDHRILQGYHVRFSGWNSPLRFSHRWISKFSSVFKCMEQSSSHFADRFFGLRLRRTPLIKINSKDLFNLGNSLGAAGSRRRTIGWGEAERRAAGSAAGLYVGQTVYLSLPPNIPAAFKHSLDSLQPKGRRLFLFWVAVASRPGSCRRLLTWKLSAASAATCSIFPQTGPWPPLWQS